MIILLLIAFTDDVDYSENVRQEVSTISELNVVADKMMRHGCYVAYFLDEIRLHGGLETAQKMFETIGR